MPDRSVGLVAGEDVEIGIEVLDVDGQMHRRLAAIDQHRDAPGMGDADDLLHRHDGAERIRHLGDGDDPGARAQKLLEFLDEEIAVIVDRRPFDHGAPAFAMEMPGHDIGMMLEDREHDLIALADHHPAEGLRHQIDRLGGIAGEDDLVRRRRVDEAAHAFARILESLGRGIGEIMQAAMDIGIVLVHRLDACARARPCGFCAEAALSR